MKWDANDVSSFYSDLSSIRSRGAFALDFGNRKTIPLLSHYGEMFNFVFNQAGRETNLLSIYMNHIGVYAER